MKDDEFQFAMLERKVDQQQRDSLNAFWRFIRWPMAFFIVSAFLATMAAPIEVSLYARIGAAIGISIGVALVGLWPMLIIELVQRSKDGRLG